MAYNVYDNWERLVRKVLREEKLRRDAFREFSRLSVSSSFSSSSSSFRQEGYRNPGNIISKGHKNCDLMRNLQLGIRLSTARFPLSVSPSDFDSQLKSWHRFPPEGSKYTPPHQSVEFLWKVYCPEVFRELREIFKLDLVDYLLSIYGNDALREISSPGESGGLIYLTPDDRFMIKKVKKSEIKVLLKILPFYYNHVQMFDNTLLTKLYGAYGYKQVGGMKARFVVMQNLSYSEYIQLDLKGWSYNDLGIYRVFRLHPHLCKTLMKQIDLDCKFLEAQSIMDYSLVLGVHSCDKNNADNIMGNGDSNVDEKLWDGLNFPATEQQDMGRVLAGQKPFIRLGANMPARAELIQFNPGSDDIIEVKIYLAISGILQDHDINKKLVRTYTSISAVDPELCSWRFRNFLRGVFREEPSS